MLRLQGAELWKVQNFRYSQSRIQSNRQHGQEVKRDPQTSWNGWRKRETNTFKQE